MSNLNTSKIMTQKSDQMADTNRLHRTSICRPVATKHKTPWLSSKKISIVASFIMALVLTTDASSKTIYSGARLINPDAPNISNSRIIVDQERIICVSNKTGCPGTENDIEVDLSDRWITPGLIDTHVHLEFDGHTLDHQRRRLAHGTTTVRDAATLQLNKLLEYRKKAVESVPLPSVVISALIHPSNAGPFGSDDPQSIAQNLKKLGVDFVKLRNAGPTKKLTEIIRAGKNAGLPVYGHTWYGPPPQSILEVAINSGLDGVAHLMGIAIGNQTNPIQQMPDPTDDPAGFWEWRKNLWLSTDPNRLDRLIDLMVRNDVWLEPTLTFEYYWDGGTHAPYCGILDSEKTLNLRDSLTGWLQSPPKPTFPRPYTIMTDFVKRFAKKGGIIVAGTDNKCPGPDIHEEIRLLRDAGLSPRQALRAATSDAARILGIAHDRGSVTAGRRADFVVFEKNPLVDPNAKIESVVLRGYEHDPQILLKPEAELFKSKRQQIWLARFAKWAPDPFIVLLLIGITLRFKEKRKHQHGI